MPQKSASAEFEARSGRDFSVCECLVEAARSIDANADGYRLGAQELKGGGDGREPRVGAANRPRLRPLPASSRIGVPTQCTLISWD